MCEVEHVFSFKNINPDLPVVVTSHSLFLIHGTVCPKCDDVASDLILQFEKSERKQTLVLGESDEFKVVIELPYQGEHYILLTYCESKIELHFQLVENFNHLSVVPLYLICANHDGSFQSDESDSRKSTDACSRIDLGIKLAQLIFAEKLNESGFGRKTFRIEGKCRSFHSELSMERVWAMSELELWNHFADEIISKEENVIDRKFVAFIGCTKFLGIFDGDDSYKNIKSKTLGNAAMGGGGLALFGTGCLYTWPRNVDEILNGFKNQKLVNLTKLMDDSNYRRNYGGCFATNIGSLCHEMGHVFNLGHTEDGIMGKSLDSVDQMFLVQKKMDRIKLPKRSVQPAGQPSRLTRIKPKGSILEDYRREKECNGIYFTQNCSTILAHHKWLQVIDQERCDKKSMKNTITYNSDTRTLISANSIPLRLIEIRETDSEMVLNFWEFGEGQETVEFQLPQNFHWKGKRLVLFAIDAQGNTFKGSTEL